MKIYTKIIYDKDDNIIEEHSYNYNGPVSQARKLPKFNKSKVNGKTEWKAQTWDQVNKISRSKAVNDKRDAFLNNDNNIGFYRTGTKFDPSQGNKMNREHGGGADYYNPITTKDYSSPYNSHYQASYDRMRSQVWELTEPEPNILHQFASYNPLFTLSALNQGEIRNPQSFFKSAPHDIIAQSSGIGAGNTSSALDTNNPNEMKSYGNTELGKNHDIYFKNVEIKSIPGHNAKRRLTSVTNITMELVEPYGLTLLEKVKDSAYQNGYLDHLDAPYLLTIEFKGFDENGKILSDNLDVTKRAIPIKLVTMDIDVNQGGAFYNVIAIPYNEFAFSNLYMYPRTSGTLTSPSLELSDAVAELQNVLNEQNKEEAKTVYGNQFPDTYQITVDEKLLEGPDQKLSYKYLSQVGMVQKPRDTTYEEASRERRGSDKPVEVPFTHDIIKFSPGTSVLKLLEELMKSHPEYGTKNFEMWAEKVQKGVRGRGTGNPNDGTDMYFKYFKIRSSIEPTTEFDPDRQTNTKIVKIVVEPYYISAYNVVTAGIHQSNGSKRYVAKAYNYIFTGDNIDVLDLDINYKVAYYQSRLKKEASSSKRPVTIPHVEEKLMNAPDNTRIPDRKMGVLNLKSETSISKTNKANKTGESDSKLDQFFDAITNPRADMVIVRMQILGDPSWLGQSQFVPPAPRPTGPGISTDMNRGYFTGGKKTNIWNPKLKCFNAEVAEPMLDLTFLIPEDIDDKRGIYEISTGQKAVFSGLYRVTEIDSSFNDGKFTQTLTMIRYNNQDRPVTPARNKKIVESSGYSSNISKVPRQSVGSSTSNIAIPDRKMGQTGKLSRSPKVLRDANPHKNQSKAKSTTRSKEYNSPR